MKNSIRDGTPYLLRNSLGDNMKCRFSIVMPAYNAEKYIEEMIQSIVNQTYKDWHLVIIDDGSTDETSRICDKYICSQIEVHHLSNSGQVHARCEGIGMAQGEYTLVVDADDYLKPECLETINRITNVEQYDMVMFPYMCCNEKLQEQGEIAALPNRVGKMTQAEILKWIIDTCNHGLVNKAIKTDIIRESIRECIDRRVSVNGDYALIIPIICRIRNGYFVNETLYNYRIYNTSVSHNYSFSHVIDTDYVTDFVIQTF